MIRLFHLALTALVLAGTSPVSADNTCPADVVTFRSNGQDIQFTAELAVTDEERSRGLMFRETMADDHGMLFVFSPPRRVGFWMRNTLIPLDMIFIDRRGEVQKIHANAIPHDETIISGGSVVYGVFEINGGLAEQLGLEVGALVQHPVFGRRALWPCP